MWAHEHKILVKMDYCNICPFNAFWYLNGVECKYGDEEWKKEQKKRTPLIKYAVNPDDRGVIGSRDDQS